MPRFLWSIIMIAALFICSCNSSEQPGSQTAPAETKTATVEQPPGKVVSRAAAPTVAPASDSTEQAKENAKDVAEQTSATSGSAAAEPDKPVSSTAGAEDKPAEALTDDTTKQAEATTADSTPAIDRKAVTEADIPEVIVLKASNGNVTFPHRMHAETHECQTCHGDGTPAAFGIDKDIAHKLCKDCHKVVGAGPTACNGCHKK